MGKVVEIPADMTARDLCQLLVYKSHCVDDNSWALVEHHPLLGLGKEASPRGYDILFAYTKTDTSTWSRTCLPFSWALTYTGAYTYTPAHACMHKHIFGQID